VLNNAAILARARWRRKRGLCTKCRKPPIKAMPGKRLCILCNSARQQYEKSAWEKARANGLCTRCKEPRDDAQKTDCQPCRAAALARSRAQKLRNREKGVCDCGKPRVEGYRRCSTCLDRSRTRRTREKAERKRSCRAPVRTRLARPRLCNPESDPADVDTTT
jgi:hypothetical protein